MLEVRFYASDRGNQPVREWLRALDAPDRRTIGEDVKTVQLGWPLGMPLVRKLEPGLWELRSHVRNGIARVLFTCQRDTLVLLHGFVKKSAKIPRAELELARRRMIEVLNG